MYYSRQTSRSGFMTLVTLNSPKQLLRVKHSGAAARLDYSGELLSYSTVRRHDTNWSLLAHRSTICMWSAASIRGLNTHRYNLASSPLHYVFTLRRVTVTLFNTNILGSIKILKRFLLNRLIVFYFLIIKFYKVFQ